MIDKLIRRMIFIHQYTDEEIVARLRCRPELVAAIRELIKIEVDKIADQDEDWDE